MTTLRSGRTPRWVPRWLNLPSPRQKSPTAQLGAEQQLHAASLSPRRPSLSPHRVPRGPTAPLPSSLPSLPSSRPSRRALPTELSPPPPSSPWVGAQSMAAQLSSAWPSSVRFGSSLLGSALLGWVPAGLGSARGPQIDPKSVTSRRRLNSTHPSGFGPPAAAVTAATDVKVDVNIRCQCC